MNVLEYIGGHWKQTLAIAGSIILAAFLIWAWNLQGGAGRTCDVALQQITESNFSYMQIELTQQDPVEPVFRGTLSFLLVDDPQVGFMDIFTTGAQGYGDMGVSGKVVRASNGKYLVGPVQDYALNPISGSHRLFPFDSADFDFVISERPKTSYSLVSIINRVEGFVLKCGDASATPMPDGKMHVRIKLLRNPILQLSAIVIALGAIAFAMLIARSKTTEALVGAAGSAFFSLWSVRSILGSQIHTFPTVLDFIILTASILLLAIVAWRTVFSRPVEERSNVVQSQVRTKRGDRNKRH